MAEKLTRWFVFGVVIASLPVLFNVFHVAIRGGAATIDTLTGRGELLLVAAAISAAAVGDLVGSGPNLRPGKILAGGGAVMVLFAASAFFMDVTAAFLKNEAIQSSLVCNTSL